MLRQKVEESTNEKKRERKKMVSRDVSAHEYILVLIEHAARTSISM